jgi:hypothetical protein
MTFFKIETGDIYYYEDLHKEEYVTSCSLCERSFRTVCIRLNGDISENTVMAMLTLQFTTVPKFAQFT